MFSDVHLRWKGSAGTRGEESCGARRWCAGPLDKSSTTRWLLSATSLCRWNLLLLKIAFKNSCFIQYFFFFIVAKRVEIALTRESRLFETAFEPWNARRELGITDRLSPQKCELRCLADLVLVLYIYIRVKNRKTTPREKIRSAPEMSFQKALDRRHISTRIKR